jgi:hypothetical protein
MNDPTREDGKDAFARPLNCTKCRYMSTDQAIF